MREQPPTYRPGAEALELITPLQDPEGMQAFFEGADQLATEAGIRPGHPDEAQELVGVYKGDPRQVDRYAYRVTEQAYADNETHNALRRNTLTGLNNRLGFREALERLGQRATPRDAVAVLLIDINAFKAVNDEMGHKKGDEVLRRVASALKRVVRTVDEDDTSDIVMHDTNVPSRASSNEDNEITLGNLSGDEFGVAAWLPDAVDGDEPEHIEQAVEGVTLSLAPPTSKSSEETGDIEAAALDRAHVPRNEERIPLADRINRITTRVQEALHQELAEFDVVGLGASIGVAVWFPTRNLSVDDVLVQADRAMFVAKAEAHRATTGELSEVDQLLLASAGVMVSRASFDPGRVSEKLLGPSGEPDPRTNPQAFQALMVRAAHLMVGFAGLEFPDSALRPLSSEDRPADATE